jgi:putative membrane protein
MRRLFGPTVGERLGAFVIRWLILAVAVWVAAKLVSGISLEGWRATLSVSLVLGLLNAYVKPFLKALALPVTILTFGLFLIAINTLLLLLADWFCQQADIHFAVAGVGAAILGAIVISIVTFVLRIVVTAGRLSRVLMTGI